MKLLSTLVILLLYSSLTIHAQWDLLHINTQDNQTNFHVDFKDEANGILLQGDNRLLRTTNGGDSWDTIATPAYNLTDFAYLAGDTLIGLGRYEDGSGLYWSYNGGNNWTVEATFEEEYIYDFAYRPEGVVLVGNRRILRYSFTTGTAAEVYNLADEGFSLLGGVEHIVQPSDSILYASGVAVTDVDSSFQTLILKSEDAGQSWELIGQHPNTNINESPKFHFWTAERGFYLLNRSFFDDLPSTFYHTTDGGQTWTTQDVDITGSNFDFSFPSDSVGFLVIGEELFGFNSSLFRFGIFKTTNGGQSWEAQFPNQPGAPIRSVDFVNDSVGYATGNFDLILKTTQCGGEMDADYPFEDFLVNTTEPEEEPLVNLYPNPATEHLNISLPAEWTAKDTQVHVYDSKGQLLIRTKATGTQTMQVPLTAVPSGLLIIEILAERYVLRRKVIKH
ncbi:MAG: T9SS type A sorting domain-containing protein [Bacteroidota bacterium]